MGSEAHSPACTRRLLGGVWAPGPEPPSSRLSLGIGVMCWRRAQARAHVLPLPPTWLLHSPGGTFVSHSVFSFSFSCQEPLMTVVVNLPPWGQRNLRKWTPGSLGLSRWPDP